MKNATTKTQLRLEALHLATMAAQTMGVNDPRYDVVTYAEKMLTFLVADYESDAKAAAASKP